MDDQKKINFAKLMLRTHLGTFGGEERAQRNEIAAILKAMRSEGYTHAQIAEFFGKYLDIRVQPGESRMAMHFIFEEALMDLIVTADRRDKACSKCPLRSFPFSMEHVDSPFTPKDKI
jgi:hypothetical protein